MGPLEDMSTILTAVSRSLLALTPTCFVGSYGVGYAIEGCFFSVLAFLICRSRRIAASSSFSREQMHAFVYRTLPTTLISALYSIIRFGGSMREREKIVS